MEERAGERRQPSFVDSWREGLPSSYSQAFYKGSICSLAITSKYDLILLRGTTPLVKAKLKQIGVSLILASAVWAICVWLLPRPSGRPRPEFTIEHGMTGMYFSSNTHTQ